MKPGFDTTMRHVLLFLLIAVIALADVAPSPGTQGKLAARLHAERSSYAGFAHGQQGWLLGSRIWLPAETDALTIGLFPLDPVNEDKALEDLLTITTAEDNLLDFGNAPAASAGGLPLADANTHRVSRPAEAVGNCMIVTNGMHGGALRLDGSNAVIRLPDYGHTGTFTVEGWFQPEILGGTLLHIPVGGPHDIITITLQPDGYVTLNVGGKKVGQSQVRLQPGQFSHVAFVHRQHYLYELWRPLDAIVFIDGTPQIWLEQALAQCISRLGGPLLAGNTPTGKAPFCGLVDDLRVSAVSRYFYAYDRTTADPLTQHPVPLDAPVMRGREELLLNAPLDGTPAAEGPFKATATGKPVKFLSARRGQGVVAGPGRGLRFVPENANLPAERGAVEFWFSPHDWDNRQGRQSSDPARAHENYNAPLLRLAVTPEGANAPQTLLTLSVVRTSTTKGFMVPYYIRPMHPGKWYHAVISWQGQSARLFINGEEETDLNEEISVFFLLPNRAINPKGARLATLDLGDFRWRYDRGTTLFDEVKLYRHPLTPTEVANAYNRYLPGGVIQPLPPIELIASHNHPRRTLGLDIELLMPERHDVSTFDLDVFKVGASVPLIEKRGEPLEHGSRHLALQDPGLTYGDYRLAFVFRDAQGQELRRVEQPHSHPAPAWLDNTLGMANDDDVMPPWTAMTWANGEIGCWGRTITIGANGWPARIVSQSETILPAAPQILLATDQGEIALTPAAAPRLVTQRDGVIETEGTAIGGGWTMTTAIRTEFDGFMKLQTRLEGPAGAEVRSLRIRFPLEFADEQLFGFYTGEHWFRAAHDFRLLPKGDGIVFASNKTGCGHPKEWQGKVSFLPYVSVGDDQCSFVWLAENDRFWTQSWEQPAITITREDGRTWLNLNIINTPLTPKEPLVYTFGLQATPIRPLAEDTRSVGNALKFGMVCGFNGFYLQAPYEGHFAFRLSPKDLDWSYPEAEAKRYRQRGGRNPEYDPLIVYMDRTWQRAPEDALEYNQDWRGWGNATRYTKPVRDAYVWYINEWVRRGLMDGIYIDDVWIDPTKSLWHLDPADNLSYKKETGSEKDYSDREWGFEFFDYRELLKRMRRVFLDNGVKPLIFVHATQTPYYPVFGFVDVMLEGEDRYLRKEGEERDFIRSWGLPRLRYANAQKWGVPVKWLSVYSPQNITQTTGLPMDRWQYRQRRAYMAGTLLHDILPDMENHQEFHRINMSAGCYDNRATFFGYWDTNTPVRAGQSNAVASVYALPGHLTLVLGNIGKTEQVVNFVIDENKVKAILGVEAVTLQNADDSLIPKEDEAVKALRTGSIASDATPETLFDSANGGTAGLAADFLAELDAKDKIAADPDGHLVHNSFDYKDGVLRLRILPNDYRLIKIKPRVSE